MEVLVLVLAAVLVVEDVEVVTMFLVVETSVREIVEKRAVPGCPPPPFVRPGCVVGERASPLSPPPEIRPAGPCVL